ncbi:MAG: hypothetical protein NTX56_13725 [Proteobacteria bacterium]|nr:hypothetical protein [Pseudomonadota bacterium]
MQSLLLNSNPVSHELIIVAATVVVCVVVAYLLSLGDGSHFGH